MSFLCFDVSFLHFAASFLYLAVSFFCFILPCGFLHIVMSFRYLAVSCLCFPVSFLFCHGFVYVAATLIILSWFCFSCHELWTTIGEAFNKLQLRGVSLSILLIKITKILCLSLNSINYIGQESRKLCAAGTSRIRKLSCFRSISKIGILQFGNT